MSKYKYLFARIREMDYKNMYRIAGQVAKKARRWRFFILLDMIFCGFKYQAGYYDYQEFEFYLLKREQRATFLTRGVNNAIIKKYNDRAFFDKFDDKVIFNQLFDGFLGRDWLDLRTADEPAFAEFAAKNPQMMAKPIDGEGGEGVEKYTIGADTDIAALFRTLKEKKQLLAEAFVVQHEGMNRLYPQAVNTLRMFTFFQDGQAHFLQAILKIGNGGVVDNFSAGGMYTFVDDTGRVIVPAVDKADRVYTTHPLTGTEIFGFQVPFFDEAVALVRKAAAVVPQVGYVGWDVAIGKDGPVLIEGNCFPGVFQIRASFNEKKEGVLPRYRTVMEI